MNDEKNKNSTGRTKRGHYFQITKCFRGCQNEDKISN